MSKLNRLVETMEPSGIRDFFDLVMGMDDVISLGVGEPDFATPWHIREAAIQSLENGYTNYTSNLGMPELRETIAEWLSERHGIGYDPEDEILVTTGVSEAMDLATRALLNPGEQALVPTPCYVSYEPMSSLAGGDVEYLPTSHETNHRITADLLREHAGPEAKLLILNYPSNPTGVTYSRDQLAALAEVVKEQDLIVIADEIYGELTFEGDHVAFPSLPGMKDHTIYLNGLSKSHAMTGLRIGYACGPAEWIGGMTKIHQYSMLSAPTTAQFAAVEALQNGDQAVASMRDEYRERRDLVVRRLNEMGLPCSTPQGAFYAFPSIESTGIPSPEFCRELLQDQRVAVVPGTAFGPEGETNVRLSFATGMDQLRTAMNRLENFLEEQNSSPGSATQSDRAG